MFQSKHKFVWMFELRGFESPENAWKECLSKVFETFRSKDKHYFCTVILLQRITVKISLNSKNYLFLQFYLTPYYSTSSVGRTDGILESKIAFLEAWDVLNLWDIVGFFWKLHHSIRKSVPNIIPICVVNCNTYEVRINQAIIEGCGSQDCKLETSPSYYGPCLAPCSIFDI